MNRVIAWFANNSVTANLMMIIILVAGSFAIYSIRLEVFPEMSSDMISVAVPFPGASPEEVEEGICVRIEEAIHDLEGIAKITAAASENVGSVNIEVEPGYDVRRLLDDVKSRVDGISTFPDQAEKPIVQELLRRRQVINIAIFGDADEKTLKLLAEEMRDDLVKRPAISQVSLAATRPYEISIEVSELALRQYALTFDEVAQAIRRASLDLSGGSIKAESGEILLRTNNQAYLGDEFENIVLRSSPDGHRLTIGDIATVDDGFADTDESARFDSEKAVLVQVFRIGDESAIEVANAVKEFVADKASELPSGIQMTTWKDDTILLKDRLSLLIKNGIAGFVLVFIALALFLRLKIAMWVVVGMIISFFGAFWMMPVYDVSLNMISLFAFILVLGIVVDDAIVVGENIYRHGEQQADGKTGAISGTQEVSKPVIFAILTTVAAFMPLLYVDGNMGKIMRFVPIIVISVLLFSLFESLLILPAHLSHVRYGKEEKTHRGIIGAWKRIQVRFVTALNEFANVRYRQFLAFCARFRYHTLALSAGALILSLTIANSTWVKFTFMPDVEADNVVALLEMPEGTPAAVTESAIAQIEAAAVSLEEELNTGDTDVFAHMLSSVGDQPFVSNRMGPHPSQSVSGSNIGEVNIQLISAEERTVTSPEIARRWRERVGTIPGVKKLSFVSSLFDAGEKISIQLANNEYDHLRTVANEVKTLISNYPGTFDISDSYDEGKSELQLRILPEAEALGLTTSDLARQVRQAFYGEEAQRIQRGRDDIRVMVRYPRDERGSLAHLENLRIRLPGGTEIPLSRAAEVNPSQGFSTITRTNRMRTITVTSDVDNSIGNANDIVDDFKESYLPLLMDKHSGIQYSFEGEQAEQRKTMQGLARGFMFALLIIYVLLAIPFKSYLQPLIVMSAIPFGFIGAIGGHLLLGMDLTILSGFGVVALTGVVVNDSLVMVDFINQKRDEGNTFTQAVLEAGVIRFRPIVLTSVTTFAGLTPLLLETSLQAQFLIPMAISLAFGVLFATVITLILVPSIYLILEDIRTIFTSGISRTRARVQPT